MCKGKKWKKVEEVEIKKKEKEEKKKERIKERAEM